MFLLGYFAGRAVTGGWGVRIVWCPKNSSLRNFEYSSGKKDSAMRNCFFTCNIRLSNQLSELLHNISCIVVHSVKTTTITTLPETYRFCKCKPI
jgi:hypothetical protein